MKQENEISAEEAAIKAAEFVRNCGISVKQATENIQRNIKRIGIELAPIEEIRRRLKQRNDHLL